MQIICLAASAADLIHHSLAAGIVKVSNDHFRALARQCRRTRCPDARCTTGYDGDLAFYLAHSFLCRSRTPSIAVVPRPSSPEMMLGYGKHRRDWASTSLIIATGRVRVSDVAHRGRLLPAWPVRRMATSRGSRGAGHS